MTTNQSDSRSVPVYGPEGKLPRYSENPADIGTMPAFPSLAGEPEYLSDYSPNDRPWDQHRSQADQVAAIYSSASGSKWFSRLGERVAACAPWLGFAWSPDRDDPHVLSLKLRQAFFCRVRLCPICQWRRSLMWTARFLQALPALMERYPRARFIFLTLSRRNPPIQELRASLTDMGKAWDRLRKRAEFAIVVGWIRAVEVTRGRDGSAHPHYHVLLMVPETYFRSPAKYVTQAEWTIIWRQSLKLDYDPIVHVAAVKPKRGRPPAGRPNVGLIGAARETLKYAVKPSDMTDSPAWLLELTRQLHKLRFVASGGALKDVLRERDERDEDLLLLSDGPTDEGAKLFFDWWRRVQRYKRRDGAVQ